MLACYKAALMEMEDNSVALILDNFPMKAPMGVLFPATMYTGD